MEKLKKIFGMTQLEKASAQALFILIFLLPMAVTGWRNLFRFYEMSAIWAIYALAMAVFTLFVYFSSIDQIMKNRSLLNINGCGFALLYFSGFIFSYALLLFALGDSAVNYTSASLPGSNSVQYLKYSFYFLLSAGAFLFIGRVFDKTPSTVKSIPSGVPPQTA